MAEHSDIPGSLLTNVFILGDFAEIAYIVCAAGLPSNAETTATVDELASQHRILTLLENAERQFRQASIIVVLDRDKAELFTFYKKADIVKDQQTVLRKFGQICQANSCKIAYKNACRIVDLLKPELARVYSLFSEAVLSSVKVKPENERSVVEVTRHVYLIPNEISDIHHESFLPEQQLQWQLEQIGLQIATSGQVLLVIQKSPWPHFLAMSDMINPEAAAVEPGAALLLVPGGQLARYCGSWHTPLTKRDLQHRPPSPEDTDAAYRRFWIELVSESLRGRAGVSLAFGPDTIWLEVEYPVLGFHNDAGVVSETVEWKKLYWPAALAYVSTASLCHQSQAMPDSVSAHLNPLVIAQHWFVKEFKMFSLQDTVSHDVHEESMSIIHDNFFDEEPQFGSPQQFMSIPMQNFMQSQTVYPTPPDISNVLHTPSFILDDPVTHLTPVQPSPAAHHSSPLAQGCSTTPTTSNDPAIPNFLKHGVDNTDEIFEVPDEGEVVLEGSLHEPNWDFFGADNLEHPMTGANTTDEINDEPMDVGHDSFGEMDFAVMEDVDHFGILTSDVTTTPLNAASPVPSATPVNIAPHTVGDNGNDSSSNAESEPTSGQSCPKFDEPAAAHLVFPKIRRPNAYEAPSFRNKDTDLKYAKYGKYWFSGAFETASVPQAPKGPSLTAHSGALPTVRPKSSSSTNSSTNTSTLSTASSNHAHSSQFVNVWAQHPAKTGTGPSTPPSNLPAASHDQEEATALLALVTADLNLSGFNFDSARASYLSQSMPLDRDMTGYRLLAEQMARATTLAHLPQLRMPHSNQQMAVSLISELHGDKDWRTLDRASLSDLTNLWSSHHTSGDLQRISSLPPSSVRSRHGDIDIASSPAMMAYWQLLNLHPMSNTKDVLAICICPENDTFVEGCERFLGRFEQTWMACNMGAHRPATLPAVAERGVARWKDLANLFQVCRDVANALGGPDEAEEYTVVYMILPDDDMMLALELCNAFIELTDQLTLTRGFEQNDTVLQLVPASFIIEEKAIIVPPEARLVDLAMEVYDRLPPQLLDLQDPGACHSAIILEPPIIGSLHFELNASNTSPILRYGQSCHVAYCISLDGRWLNATWTNDIGTIELTMSFCFYDDGHSQRSRLEVFECICEATTQLMSRQKTSWYLVVAKVGLFTKQESQEWHSLAAQLCKDQPHLTRILLATIELESRMTIYINNSTNVGIAPPFLNTPVSTPQPVNTTSPEQSTFPGTPSTTFNLANNAPTPPDPGAENMQDPGVLLSDPLDNVWAAVFGFGFNQGYEAGDARLSIISGLLLKRSAQEVHGTTTNMMGVGVNLVGLLRKTSEAGGVLTAQDRMSMLHDLLQQYRGLNTLAVARHTIQSTDPCIPWHAATAYKSIKALEAFV